MFHHRTYHPNFSEVAPYAMRKTREETQAEELRMDIAMSHSKAYLAAAVRNGARILPALT